MQDFYNTFKQAPSQNIERLLIFSTSIAVLQPNLATASCGWLPVWLHYNNKKLNPWLKRENLLSSQTGHLFESFGHTGCLQTQAPAFVAATLTCRTASRPALFLYISNCTCCWFMAPCKCSPLGLPHFFKLFPSIHPIWQ